jgi:hypothetical protein
LPDREAKIAQSFPELGCPATQDTDIPLARQIFERGFMVWRGDQYAILVLNDNGTWHSFADTWQAGQPEMDSTLDPPQGTQQPVRGFGKVWRDELGGASAQIGWATEGEQSMSGSVQEWDGGLTLRIESKTYVLLNTGVWKVVSRA